jgi:hypothetical protein
LFFFLAFFLLFFLLFFQSWLSNRYMTMKVFRNDPEKTFYGVISGKKSNGRVHLDEKWLL